MINTGEKNIITLEDPIEYELKGVTQMQVNPAVNFTFATGLRTIVRQDPNVIMVGEVRDKETAEMAIDAAITGHLVMTTMHTIDSTTVFTRLADMGIDSRRYASALVIIIAQRLIRVNCPKCRKPYPPDPKSLMQLRFDQSAKDIIFLKGEGCAHCQQTGFHGRNGLFEMLVADHEIRTLLEQNAAASRIRELARHRGMCNIREEGILKVMRGQTTAEEVVRATM
jgi:general secretion pathway protein E